MPGDTAEGIRTPGALARGDVTAAAPFGLYGQRTATPDAPLHLTHLFCPMRSGVIPEHWRTRDVYILKFGSAA